MRVFLDTNVLVAAFATRGICADLFRAVLLEHDLITGEPVLREIHRVLVRKLKFPEPQTREIIRFLRDHAEVTNPKKAASWPETDADDRWIVAAALEGKAEILVTGDKDLLEAKKQTDIRVVSPRGFWELLKAD
jgi:putative PIN family toxin of toxin-antitoxin system